MSSPITHVIFDFDGCLVNSVDVVVDIFRQLSFRFGRQMPTQIIGEINNSTSLSDCLHKYMNSLDVKLEKQQLFQEFVQMFSNGKFELIPGVEKLVKHLHKHNISMAIATGTAKREFDIISQQFGNFFEFGNYFSHSVCCDDKEVLRKKPNPDVYIVCAKRFKPQPKHLQNILVIEDSFTGITGAVASGMKTLLINDRKYCTFAEIADKITLIADTFDDFKPESLGLPAYESKL